MSYHSFRPKILSVDGKPISIAEGQTNSAIVKAILPGNIQLTNSPVSTPATAPQAASSVSVSNGSIVNAVVVTPNNGAASYLPPA